MLYECTITLVPHWTRRKSARDQFIQSAKELIEVLSEFYKKTTPKASFIAELHKSNDVHYHGIVELTDHCDRDRFINCLRGRSIFGRRTITQIVNYQLYCDYMNKEVSVTRSIIGDPIVIDHFNVYCDPQYRFVEDRDKSNEPPNKGSAKGGE